MSSATAKTLCPICNDEAIFLESFKPYSDKSWNFDVYDCLKCRCRFALRDADINYHEEIHTSENSPYTFHYQKAKTIKKLLNDSQKCGEFLGKTPTLKKLFEILEDTPKDAYILELGCSSGYVTAYLQSIGYKNTFGIDISQSAIEYATKEFGEFYALEEQAGQKYSIIFHTGVIGCVDHPMDFLQHYLNLLDDDGIMLFNAPNADAVREIDELWSDTPPPDLITLFDKNIFKEHFGDDFDVETTVNSSAYFVYEKIKAKILGKKYNSYPTTFSQTSKPQKPKSNFEKKIDRWKYKIINFLMRQGIIKKYSDDYGLIVKISK